MKLIFDQAAWNHRHLAQSWPRALVSAVLDVLASRAA